MLPTAEETQEFWRLFGASPLFASWPSAREDLSSRLRVRHLLPGDRLYTEESPPDALYLVTNGRIEQVVPRNGPPIDWLSRTCGPRDLVGEQGLLTGAHHTRAVAATVATVFVLAAADLRQALERDPKLHELLLPDRIAGRLRRIPLLSDLTDTEIRWLASVARERDFPAGASLPLRSEGGLWLVICGQLEVLGPIAGDAKKRRISAGNFLLAPGSSPGSACVANTAAVVLPSRLVHLPWSIAQKILALPRARELAASPFEPMRVLAGAPLFDDERMRPQQRQHLAEICGWEFVPSGRNITTQGEVGQAYVVLRAGQAVITAVDESGRVRPHNVVEAGYSYGETSLLEGKPRDATVRALASRLGGNGPLLRGVEVVTVDRRDLWTAVHERPALWRQPGSITGRMEQISGLQRFFGWQGEGEKIVWAGRGHNLWLVGPEIGLGLSFAFSAWLLNQILHPLMTSSLLMAILLTGLLFIPLGMWTVVNYYDDYCVVTTRRVTRRDRRLLIYESRVESPIETVQSVTVDTSFWGRLFGFGDLTIRTAAKVGAIVFAHVPNPDSVKGHILAGKGVAIAARRSQQQEALRQGLIGELGMALPVPDRTRALGIDPVPSRGLRRHEHSAGANLAAVEQHSRRPLPGSRRSWLVRQLERWSRRLPGRWGDVVFGSSRNEGVLPGQIVWRKHWLSLVQRTAAPLLLLAALAVAPVVAREVLGEPLLHSWASTGIVAAWLVGLLASGGLLWYQFEDYRNDLYVVTDDKIIDIEKRPLGLSAKRREGNLDRVQSVDAVQPGLWANLLNYGNVVIRTAASDEGFDFVRIGNPKLVQSIIFQRLETLRQRQERDRVVERQRELIEGLRVYHEVREEGLSEDND